MIAELHRSIRLYHQQPRLKEKKYKHVKVRPLEPEPLMHFVVMEDEPDEEKASSRFILPTATVSHDERDNNEV